MKNKLLITTALVALFSANNAFSQVREDLIVDSQTPISNQGIDEEPYYYKSIKVEKEGSLNIETSNIKTEQDITVLGGLDLKNSVLEAGNDADDQPNNSNILLDGATVTMNDSDLEANGNITIKDTSLSSVSTIGEPDNYGIWADGNINVDGGKLKISDSYLSAEGDIVFNGGTPIVPDLDLKLEHTGNGVTSYITLKGMAFRPKLEMSSNPYLPSDEVLAHILFSRSMSELSDFEKIRLATVLTSLVGFDISSGITATTKNLFGLDVLSIDSRQSAGGEEEVSVQLGKYLRNNVYIGLEQEVSSPDTSGVLQYEVNENFSLGTKAGTEESEIGFKWKYDY